MALKFAFLFVIAFMACQVMSFNSDRYRRDAPATKDSSQTIDEIFNNLKTGFNDLVQQAKGNELFSNLTLQLQEFGKQVEAQGKALVQKVQTNN